MKVYLAVRYGEFGFIDMKVFESKSDAKTFIRSDSKKSNYERYELLEQSVIKHSEDDYFQNKG
jgi:hypothetical protein